MAERDEDVKPLARISDRPSTSPTAPTAPTTDAEDGRWEVGVSKKKIRRRRCLLCCSCCLATMIVLGILILVLALTVFKIKDPEININSVTIDRLNIDLGSRELNITLTTDLSVKNPNAASFRFRNSTALVNYDGETVGEAKIPLGKASARRTLRMNVTIDLMGDRLLAHTNYLLRELASGTLTVGAYTKLGGRVNVLNIIKRHADVVMNCTLTIAVSSQTIENKVCHREVRL